MVRKLYAFEPVRPAVVCHLSRNQHRHKNEQDRARGKCQIHWHRTEEKAREHQNRRHKETYLDA
jgi:hypothetical protein